MAILRKYAKKHRRVRQCAFLRKTHRQAGLKGKRGGLLRGRVRDIFANRIVPLLFLLVFSFFMCHGPAFGKEKAVQQDSNKDGKIDRIARIDENGKIIGLEIDSNTDGVMDRFQYYSHEKVIRVESDSNHDKKIDQWNYFEDEKRIRHERASTETDRLNQIIDFDQQERPLKIRKDTTGDGLFDSISYFKEGRLSSSTKDTDGDGKINVLQTYRDDKPVERHIDDNGDGRYERITFYDSEGLPKESRHDMNNDGHMEVVRIYRKGSLFEQKKDSDKDGRFEIITRFKDDQPYEQQEDRNRDGLFDIMTRYKACKPSYQARDTNYDGKKDFFSHFDARGLLERTEEDSRFTGRIDRIRTYNDGVPVRVLHDADGDGFKETLTFFKNGTPCLQTQDNNADGKADAKLHFNGKGEKVKAESDLDLNGKIDNWEYYRAGHLSRIEKDEVGKGRISLKIFFKKGKKYKLIMDRDNDGLFETTQWFDRPQWSTVMELDADGDGNPEGRYCYKNSILRLKEIDENGDGTFDLKEFYNADGKLIKSRERLEHGNGPDITWFYDNAEEAVRAEKDNNKDGRVDTWYHYYKGRLMRVEEDTNNDGKADLWEEYDESEALVKRSKDLNLDGKPDVEEYEGEQASR